MKMLSLCLVVSLTLPAATGRADQFPDDHADAVSGATPVTFGAQAGTIEIDTDRDVFQFVAEPGRQYAITVTPGTLDDATVRIRTGDGSVIVSTAHSVGDSQSMLIFPHAASSAPVPLEVCGFAKYTSGTYTLLVTDQPVADIDGDGMADAWETAFFTNLTQTASGDPDDDGLSNRDEYELGYDPLDAASRFVITEAALDGQPRMLQWVSAPYRTYDVQAAGDATSTNWVSVGSVPGNTSSASYSDASGGGESARFWRIRVQ